MLQGVAESPEFVDYISHGLFTPPKTLPLSRIGEREVVFLTRKLKLKLFTVPYVVF
jgi:hypothetical protein